MLGIKLPLKVKVTTKYFQNRVLHMKSNLSDFQKLSHIASGILHVILHSQISKTAFNFSIQVQGPSKF